MRRCFRCQYVGYSLTEFVRKRGWTWLWEWCAGCACEPNCQQAGHVWGTWIFVGDLPDGREEYVQQCVRATCQETREGHSYGTRG